MRLHVKLEHNLLIQGLIELKWMSKEAVPLLSTKMYETEASTVGKLRAHGLTSEAIFESAIFANQTAAHPLPVVDLALMKPIQDFDFATFATLEEMLAQFVVPVMQLGDRLIVATADPSNAKFFDTLALRSPLKLEYWLAESEAIKAQLLAMNIVEKKPQSQVSGVLPEVHSDTTRIEPTLSDENVSADIDVKNDHNAEEAMDETIVIDEFEDAYPEAETVRYVDSDENIEDEIVEEEITESADSSDRFALLQDSALDVDELESKSQAIVAEEGIAAEEMIAMGEVERSEVMPEEGLISHDEEGDTTVEALEVISEEDFSAAEHPVLIIPAQESAEITAVPVDDNSSQNSAVMLREVLDEVGSKAQERPAEDDIIEYINYILLDAITQKASDIHFEPYESSYRIRFRIDGILHKVYAVPEQYRQTIASRLKVMAELDIAEKRLPQDGHITICLGEDQEDEVDARISVMPTLWGEKVVIRLLDRSEMNISLAKLGLTVNQKNQLQSAIERSQGLVLVTGPTGSGKTVTLYACLNHLNQASRNIATVEDPIEINLEGVNQLQVHSKIGLDFVEALRAFLRQDPDVLMVGEIRDYETADITIKAAQTGHLVLSTLHTNSAVESLLRLQNMGIESYNTASTVKLIVAQRLVRELCHCKEEDIVDSGYLETLGFTPQQAASKFYRASGCSECHDGYRGRFAIFEVMPISKRMTQLMLESAPAAEIRQQAEREGVKSLRQSGIDKIMEGRTSLEEVLRVTTE